MGVLYGDVEELKITLGVNDDELDDDIERKMDAASRDIEDITGQRFYQSDVETRYFKANWRVNWVYTGPISAVTSIHIDQNLNGSYSQELTLTDDYILEPLNAVAMGEPWRYIVLPDYSNFWWPRCGPNVKVIGRFGWESVPAKIREACDLLTARYLARKDAPFGVIPGEDTATRIWRTDPDVANMLAKYQTLLRSA